MIFRVKRGPLETVKDQILIHGELLVDTTDWIIRMGDSETPGGRELSNTLKILPRSEVDSLVIQDNHLIADNDDWILRVGDGVTPGGKWLSMSIIVDTSSNLESMIIPRNVLAFDTDSQSFIIGDGVTSGGTHVIRKIYVDSEDTINSTVVEDGVLVADNDNWVIRVGDGYSEGGNPLSTRIIVDTKPIIDAMVIPENLLAVDTEEYILRVGDGITAGGIFLTDDAGSGGTTTDPGSDPPVYSRMVTDTKVQITGDSMPLSKEAMGGLVMNSAFVYPDIDSDVATEYTCHINTSNYTEVLFDSGDSLNGKYATVSYMSTGAYVEDSLITTVDKGLISSNQVQLPSESLGDIAFNCAKVFDSQTSEIYDEYTCSISNDNLKCLFDAADNLNGKYATFSYQSVD